MTKLEAWLEKMKDTKFAWIDDHRSQDAIAVIEKLKEALNDADNHWHHPDETTERRQCTACEALAIDPEKL